MRFDGCVVAFSVQDLNIAFKAIFFSQILKET